jgi:hypothetical protein
MVQTAHHDLSFSGTCTEETNDTSFILLGPSWSFWGIPVAAIFMNIWVEKAPVGI